MNTIQRILLLAVLLLCVGLPAKSATFFVSQAGGTASCGTDGSQSTISVATLNATSADWVGGSVIKLCGTITTVINAPGSGASGNPILLQWESSASLSACSATGALKMPGRSNIIVDLGGNNSAITCPNNGTGLGTQTNVLGIGDGTSVGNFGGSGFANIEIRNGQVGPLFIHSGSANQGTATTAIAFDSHSGNKIHNIKFQDTAFSVKTGLVIAGTNGDATYNNSFNNSATGEWYASEGSPGSATGFQFYGNDFTVAPNWATTANAVHMEAIHIFANGTGTSITGSQIYNNRIHGSWPAVGGTSALFVEQASCGDGSVQSVKIFNNILDLTGSTAIPGDGMIFVPCQKITAELYNNTINCAGVSNSTGMELDGGTSQVFTVRNNIFTNCTTNIYDPTSGGSFAGDHNIYNGGGWYFAGVSKSSIALWRTASGMDANSSTSAPGLNSDYTITNSLSLAHTIGGDNLTSLSVAALDMGAAATSGANGSCGTACLARPATGVWDVGAYQLAGTPACPVIQ